MLTTVPYYLDILFFLTTMLTVFLVWNAIRNSETHQNYAKWIFIGSLLYLTFQAVMAYNGFYYKDTLHQKPPHLPMTFAPLIILIVGLFVTKKGRKFIDALPPDHVAMISIVRIPVEICLFLLFTYDAVPELMTFEGRNPDIIAGIGAPIIAFYGWKRKKLGKTILWIWNIISLGLLINIVTNAVLATPFSFQQQAFDQPNVGVLYFPYVWLPAYIVPAVLFNLLANFRHLVTTSNNSGTSNN